MANEVVAVELEGGRRIMVEAMTRGDEKVAFSMPKFSGFAEAVTDISRAVMAAIDAVKPDSAEVEFGIDASIESGELTALLVKGTGTANLKITLSWKADRP
ncbi:CU044_2847 family protein [Variovorax sp. M-6]|uniref:CU044_2847 family protein n=1 Tax=Variovorax sp. M-6 TaxID=3233041 RepID=UPI003F954424